MKRKHFLFLFRQSPASGQGAKEGLDALLATAAFEQTISVVFMGDGIWQLQPNQQLRLANLPAVDKQLEALSLYDIDRIFLHKPSADARGMATTNPAITVDWIDDSQLGDLIQSADQVLTF